MEKQKELISCICMTCGIRNDHTNPNGYCQNGHDNWLEYKDVIEKNNFFQATSIRSGLTEDKFTELFMDNSVKQIRLFDAITSHRVLLVKYIEHVRQCEGIDFIDRINNKMDSDVIFTEDEDKYLKSISSQLQDE